MPLLPPQRERARHELRAEMEQARTDIDARLLLAVDGAGNLIEVVGAEQQDDAYTLAALGAANLAASLQMIRLAKLQGAGVPLLIAEGSAGSLVLAGQPESLTFIALLGSTGILGLARITVRRLAETLWRDAPNELSGDEAVTLAGEFLASLDDVL